MEMGRGGGAGLGRESREAQQERQRSRRRMRAGGRIGSWRMPAWHRCLHNRCSVACAVGGGRGWSAAMVTAPCSDHRPAGGDGVWQDDTSAWPCATKHCMCGCARSGLQRSACFLRICSLPAAIRFESNESTIRRPVDRPHDAAIATACAAH